MLDDTSNHKLVSTGKQREHCSVECEVVERCCLLLLLAHRRFSLCCLGMGADVEKRLLWIRLRRHKYN